MIDVVLLLLCVLKLFVHPWIDKNKQYGFSFVFEKAAKRTYKSFCVSFIICLFIVNKFPMEYLEIFNILIRNIVREECNLRNKFLSVIEFPIIPGKSTF